MLSAVDYCCYLTLSSVRDMTGDVLTLKELGVDYNNISRLPMSFYKLIHLKILRVEGLYYAIPT